MAHPVSRLPYVTKRAFSFTLEDLRVYNNCMRVMIDAAPRGMKTKVSMRDLVMKLMRIYENQNKDVLKRLWAADQVRSGGRRGLPEIILK